MQGVGLRSPFDGQIAIRDPGRADGQVMVADLLVMGFTGGPVHGHAVRRGGTTVVTWRTPLVIGNDMVAEMHVILRIRTATGAARIVGTFRDFAERVQGRGRCARG